MIRRIAYVSRPRPNLSLVEIPRIVAACRRNNALDSITGVLLFTGLEFAELIEGEPQAAEQVWTRIRQDERHGDIDILFDERGPERWFTDWRVGFPSNSVLVGRIAAWRDRAGRWDDAAREEMRAVLAEADTL